MIRVFIVVAVLVCAGAWGREPDGRLGLLLVPNETRPALVVAGESFEVLARGQANLALQSSETSVPLSVSWELAGGGLFRGTCVVVPGIAPGRYSLKASDGSMEDTVSQSVFVYETFPKSYTVAIVSNPRIGVAGIAVERIRRSVMAVREAGAALVLIAGDFTAEGTAEQFAQGLNLTGEYGVPTFICSGNADRALGLAREFLGPMPFAFRFGPDGYLAHDLPPLDGLDLEGHAGDVHRLRRSIRAARWSVGFGGAYRLESEIRDQLVLFHDDPLDVWIAAAGGDAQSRVTIPWGKTIGYGLPDAAAPGTVLFVEVGLGGVKLAPGPE